MPVATARRPVGAKTNSGAEALISVLGGRVSPTDLADPRSVARRSCSVSVAPSGEDGSGGRDVEDAVEKIGDDSPLVGPPPDGVGAEGQTVR